MRLRARIDRHSIEARVIILQAAGWLTLLILVGITAWTSSRELARLSARRAQQMAAVVAQQLDQAIAADLARVQALSGAAALAHTDESAVSTVALGDLFFGARLIESIRLLDRSGRILRREPGRAAVPPVDTAAVQDALDSGRLRAVSLSSETLRTEILVPLRDDTGEPRIVAGVVLTPDARSVRDLLALAEARVVARDEQTADSRVALSLAPWAVAVPATSAAWLVPWRTLAWALPASFVLAIVFAVGTSLSVRRPALALIAAAERMADGDLETPLPAVPDGDEIGRLANALERMRVALHRDAWRRQTLRKVITAQEEERRRIARELHDDTAQSLAAVGVAIEAALEEMPDTPARARLEQLKGHVNGSLSELHRVIYDLRPSVLDDLGLAAAVRWLADEYSRRTGVAIKVETCDLEERLPPDIETAVFRVVQESLSNIERHAAADAALVQISREGAVLSVEIEDDGKGFEPEAVSVTPESARGLGLQGMRERVELLGGTFAITASPGCGTRVAVTVPV